MPSDETRARLEKAVVDAVRALLDATGAEAFVLPLSSTQDPRVYVAVGPAEHIVGMLIPGDDADHEPAA
jgi:hypothetical protein